jgi:hypothetical protein
MEPGRWQGPAPEERAGEPVTAAAPARPAADVTGMLMACQATGGNQMVLRLLADSAAAPHAPAGSGVADSIRGRTGGGSPLPPDVRAEAEAGLGQRLGDVRLHTDAPAAALATRLGAHAFTTGNDIFFNQGEYDPGSPGGFNVLVHELTHTLQQASGPVDGRPAMLGLTVSDVHDADERQARSVADRVTARRSTLDVNAPDLAPAPTGGGSSGIAVQRHSSFEHTLLGDTPPLELGNAAVTAQARGHLLSDLWARMLFFSADPGGDPRARFPDVRWIQLSGSGLWVSNGELNGLADYLPDPSTADGMTREQLVPVLQKMRSGIRSVAGAEFGLRGDDMHGMAFHWTELVSKAGGDVIALDEATSALGPNRYAGLLSRNACHFAPFSWHRWEQFHNEAAEEARQHFRSRTDSAPLRDVPKGTEEHARQALLKAGYADHFLQDSFAAGHLVNKTLVMQWWVDYLNEAAVSIPFTSLKIGRRGQPDDEVMRRMGSADAPELAGRGLYDQTPTSKATNRDDRAHGHGVTDPQTAQERTDRRRRLEGAGVAGVDEADREADYQAYLRLLNNAQAQGAAGSVHDHFNAVGLTVVSGDGSVRMRVGGDDTLLSQSDSIGALAAAHAAALSRQAIDELMNTGTTAITTEYIFGLVPTSVEVAGVAMPLEQWQDNVLRKLCFETIFPDYYATLKSAIIGAFGDEMVEGGVSRDAGKAPSALIGAH